MTGRLVVAVVIAGLLVVLLLARARARASARLDPFTVGEPWRGFAQDAVQAQRRFRATVQRMRPGPLRDRLADVAARIDDGVRTCWDVAQRGDRLDAGLRQLDVGTVQRKLAMVADDDPARTPLEAQLAAAHRIAAQSAEVRARLRVLTARLDEAVARAVELSVAAHELSEVDPVAGDVDAVVDELEALRAAVAESG